MSWMILFKKQLFDPEVKGQGPTKVITECDTPPYGHAPHTKYHWPIWKDKKVMVRTRKYYLKKHYLTLRSKVKGQDPTKVIMVRDTPPYGHAPTYQIQMTYLERQKSYGPDKFRWEEVEEAEAEEKIRLNQYVSLRSKGRHN